MCISSGSVKSHDIILQYNCFLSSVFEVGNTAESSRMTPEGNIQTEVTAGKGEYIPNTSKMPQMVFSLEACLVATALKSLETTYLFGCFGGTLVGKF